MNDSTLIILFLSFFFSISFFLMKEAAELEKQGDLKRGKHSLSYTLLGREKL